PFTVQPLRRASHVVPAPIFTEICRPGPDLLLRFRQFLRFLNIGDVRQAHRTRVPRTTRENYRRGYASLRLSGPRRGRDRRSPATSPISHEFPGETPQKSEI